MSWTPLAATAVLCHCDVHLGRTLHLTIMSNQTFPQWRGAINCISRGRGLEERHGVSAVRLAAEGNRHRRYLSYGYVN